MTTGLVVFVKEVRENLRDRRTIVNTLVTGPLLSPLLFALIFNVAVKREWTRAEAPLEVPVVGAARAPRLVEALKQQGVRVLPGPGDPEAAVRNQDVDLVLRIPEGFDEAWRKSEPAQVDLIYDASQRDSAGPRGRLSGMLNQYGSRVGALRLVARGISPSLVSPLVVAERDQSTSQSRSGLAFMMLPYIFILGAFMGGMALAIDTTAGERERQSLEPLFVNPVSRTSILAGKLCATSLFAVTTVLMSILAFGVAAPFFPTERLGMTLDLGPRFTGRVLLVMLPLAVLLSSLQTLVAAFAKSHREAQTYISLLMLIPILPSVLLSVLPVKAKLWMFAVPLMGQHLTILRLLRGEAVTWTAVAACLAATSVAALLACALTAIVYRRESLAISA